MSAGARGVCKQGDGWVEFEGDGGCDELVAAQPAVVRIADVAAACKGRGVAWVSGRLQASKGNLNARPPADAPRIAAATVLLQHLVQRHPAAAATAPPIGPAGAGFAGPSCSHAAGAEGQGPWREADCQGATQVGHEGGVGAGPSQRAGGGGGGAAAAAIQGAGLLVGPRHKVDGAGRVEGA